jgi:predicted amidohydrolase YtcJ
VGRAPGLWIREAEVEGRIVDVRIEAGRVIELADSSGRAPKRRRVPPTGTKGGTETVIGGRPAPAARAEAEDEVFEAGGGALLPGLHDHHIHLLALAAAARSVRVGPGDVRGAERFAEALRAADAALEPGRWVRAVGYHESVAGPLDRNDLDAIVPRRPVRVQHRGGAMWVVISAALDALGLASAGAGRRAGPEGSGRITGGPDPSGGIPAGVERGADGRPTGRLFGLDAWLGERVPREPLDLGAVGRMLLDYGVTGVTDATPTERSEDLALLAVAVADGALPQRVVVTGGPNLDPGAGPGLERGPVKLVVADHALPDLDRLAGDIAAAHRRRRPVAIHCVTRVGLLLALAAWDEAGPRAGDRIEHGAVVHPAEAQRIAAHGLTVVTQPAFVAERGDDYLADVEADDRPHLWPCAGLLRAGIAVGGSTDAPFGPADPWRAIAAAITRRTPTGRILGADERLDARRALDLFLGPPGAPGGPPRRIAPGTPADLCLLAVPLEDALRAPAASLVAATIRAGYLTTPMSAQPTGP